MQMISFTIKHSVLLVLSPLSERLSKVGGPRGTRQKKLLDNSLKSPASKQKYPKRLDD